MSNYKLSIIIPVYNSEKYIKDSLDSLINQTIGIENLEVIIVNDASTDSTWDILNEYCLNYPNFKVINLEKNIGAAYGPRNIAIENVTTNYIMFLDADDTFTPTACEVLYNEIKETDANMVFGRYYRVYDEIKLKSYSPYDNSDNDIKTNPNFKGLISFMWSEIIYRAVYGKNKPYKDKIILEDINQNPEILKILPSIWTKIVKKDSITRFPELITGEDLNFILDIYNKGHIIFLNNEFITNYQMRFDTSDLSITKNIKFKLVYDSIRAYKMAIQKSIQYDFKEYHKMINPFLLNYINLLRQSNFSKRETELLSLEIQEIDEIYKNPGIIGFLLVKFIKLIHFSNKIFYFFMKNRWKNL